MKRCLALAILLTLLCASAGAADRMGEITVDTAEGRIRVFQPLLVAGPWQWTYFLYTADGDLIESRAADGTAVTFATVSPGDYQVLARAVGGRRFVHGVSEVFTLTAVIWAPPLPTATPMPSPTPAPLTGSGGPLTVGPASASLSADGLWLIVDGPAVSGGTGLVTVTYQLTQGSGAIIAQQTGRGGAAFRLTSTGNFRVLVIIRDDTGWSEIYTNWVTVD